MGRKKYGPISKVVRDLCVQLCLMNGSKDEFKEGLSKLILTGATFHSIGTSLQKWIVELCKDNPEYVWELADQVDVRIRKAWKKYRGDFLDVN